VPINEKQISNTIVDKLFLQGCILGVCHRTSVLHSLSSFLSPTSPLPPPIPLPPTHPPPLLCHSPGNIHFFINGISVSISRRSTTSKKQRCDLSRFSRGDLLSNLFLSIPPKTQAPSTGWPCSKHDILKVYKNNKKVQQSQSLTLLYFIFPNLLRVNYTIRRTMKNRK
jgi:hypothetical protein